MDSDRLRAAGPAIGTAAALLLAAALGARLWFGSSTPEEPPPPAPVVLDPAGEEAETVTVHVSGWVAVPGLVVLPAGSRVADAVAAAGGGREGSRLDALNLAEPVADGGRVVVPGPDAEPGLAEPGEVAVSAGDGKVALNRASLDELQTLPGVGPVLAERILAHREANGPFRTVEDLLDVPGIGEGRLADLRDRIVVP